jgi:hypothetical protein
MAPGTQSMVHVPSSMTHLFSPVRLYGILVVLVIVRPLHSRDLCPYLLMGALASVPVRDAVFLEELGTVTDHCRPCLNL